MAAWIIGRKFVYLKKLSPDVVEDAVYSESSFWVEFFPEIATELKKINTTEYQVKFLADFEKFLRKLRLLSLKIDSATNGLIHRVRKSAVHHETLLINRAAEEEQKEALAGETANGNGKPASVRLDPHEEEQRLIIEIAKNPKDPDLFKKLGEIYFGTGEYQDAYQSFKRASDLDPEDITIRNKLARVLKKIEKLPT